MVRLYFFVSKLPKGCRPRLCRKKSSNEAPPGCALLGDVAIKIKPAAFFSHEPAHLAHLLRAAACLVARDEFDDRDIGGQRLTP